MFTEEHIRAVVFPGDGAVELTSKPAPVPAAGEILLAMRAAGVCGSDLHFAMVSADEQRHSKLGKGMDRDPALTPGHEMAGSVAAVGEGVTSLRVGDRVAVHHYSGCGECRSCRMGWDTMCKFKSVYTLQRDGGFQDLVAIKARDCVRIPDQLSYATAAFIACGGGTSFQAIRRGTLAAGETLASVGLGPVGLSALLWGKASGAKVIGLDTNPVRRDFASSLGVDHVLDPLAADLLESIDALTGREGADVTVETAGNSAGRRLALDVTRPWGTTVYVSFGGETHLDAPPQLVQRQLTLRGSWMFSMSTLIDALDFAATHDVGLEQVITTTCTIEEAPDAIKAFAAGGSGKTVITWDDVSAADGVA